MVYYSIPYKHMCTIKVNHVINIYKYIYIYIYI